MRVRAVRRVGEAEQPGERIVAAHQFARQRRHGVGEQVRRNQPRVSFGDAEVLGLQGGPGAFGFVADAGQALHLLGQFVLERADAGRVVCVPVACARLRLPFGLLEPTVCVMAALLGFCDRAAQGVDFPAVALSGGAFARQGLHHGGVVGAQGVQRLLEARRLVRALGGGPDSLLEVRAFDAPAVAFRREDAFDTASPILQLRTGGVPRGALGGVHVVGMPISARAASSATCRASWAAPRDSAACNAEAESASQSASARWLASTD